MAIFHCNDINLMTLSMKGTEGERNRKEKRLNGSKVTHFRISHLSSLRIHCLSTLDIASEGTNNMAKCN